MIVVALVRFEVALRSVYLVEEIFQVCDSCTDRLQLQASMRCKGFSILISRIIDSQQKSAPEQKGIGEGVFMARLELHNRT